MRSEWRRKRWRELIYELLLGLCLMVLASFAFPRLTWLGSLGYALIALLLTQLVMIRKPVLTLQDRLYQALGLVALSALLLWLLTPVRWETQRRAAGVELGCAGGVERDPPDGTLGHRTACDLRHADGCCRGLSVAGTHSRAGHERSGNHSARQLRTPRHPDHGCSRPKLHGESGQRRCSLRSITSPSSASPPLALETSPPSFPSPGSWPSAQALAGPLYLAVVMGVLIGRYAGDREIEDRLGATRSQSTLKTNSLALVRLPVDRSRT